MTAYGTTSSPCSLVDSTRHADDDPTRDSSNARCPSGTSNEDTTGTGHNQTTDPQQSTSNPPNWTVLQLTPIRIGRSVRFSIEHLEQFVADRIADGSAPNDNAPD